MKYYLIAGEASGDLHASHLIASLSRMDPEAEFRGFGGDEMAAAGCHLVKHYRDLAYMGIGPVLRHLPQILGGMREARHDILAWQPTVVILVDYPGFNMRMAKFVHTHTQIPVYYYIAPKIWAWKEWRIRSIRRFVDEMFSILPFEVDFFEGKHHYPIHYVGNPTADEVRHYLSTPAEDPAEPYIVLLPGSRRQEIRSNLPAMLEAVSPFANSYRIVIAGAPAIQQDLYDEVMQTAATDSGGSATRSNSSATCRRAEVVFGQTFALLRHAHAALVTSGTATLETALFGVPQVVCYATPMPSLVAFMRRYVLKVRWVSLVNLIAQREVVNELVADTFSVENIREALRPLLNADSEERQAMLNGYRDVWHRLGETSAPNEAARVIRNLLTNTKN